MLNFLREEELKIPFFLYKERPKLTIPFFASFLGMTMKNQQFQHRDEKLNEVLRHDFKMQLNCFVHFPKADWPKIQTSHHQQLKSRLPKIIIIRRIIPKLKNVVIHSMEEEIQSRKNCKERNQQQEVFLQIGKGKIKIIKKIQIHNNPLNNPDS